MFASRLLRLRPLVATSAAASAAALACRSTESQGWFSSSKPKVELKYFAVQGAAETIRYVMALGDCQWTEAGWPVRNRSSIPRAPATVNVRTVEQHRVLTRIVISTLTVAD